MTLRTSQLETLRAIPPEGITVANLAKKLGCTRDEAYWRVSVLGYRRPALTRRKKEHPRTYVLTSAGEEELRRAG